MARALIEGLNASLEAPDVVECGCRVMFRLAVTNSSSRSVDLHLRGRKPTLDIVVSNARGDIVWHRLAGSAIPASLQLHTLAAGETLTVSAIWDPRRDHEMPSAGSYAVSASLLTEGPAIEAPARQLRITA